jgi:hypothetical protein
MNTDFFKDILADHDIIEETTTAVPDSQLPELDLQPANKPEPEPFVVGANIDSYGDRTALPKPRWPNPGQPRTQEIAQTHFMEDLLWSQATRALRDCIRWTNIRITQPSQWSDPYCGPPKDLYAEAWSWLMGLWQGQKITPPTEQQMVDWALAYGDKNGLR